MTWTNLQTQMNRREKIQKKKGELLEATREAEQALFLEFEKTKASSQELTENALLLSGSVIMGFIVIQLFQKKRRGPGPPKSKTGHLELAGFSVRNRVYKRFLQYLTMFLLGIARKKLVKFLTGNEHEKIDDTKGSVQKQG